MVTKHPIMSGHSPHQMPLSKGQNWQINGQFIAASLLIILAHSYPLSPSIAYKKRPRHLLPPHTGSSSFHRVRRSSIFVYLPVLSNSNAPVHSPISDDLVTEMLPTFSSTCSPMSLISYPKNHTKRSPDAVRTSFTMIAARCLYTSYIHDCNFLIILPCC
jgi:hypothetical protein